MPTEFFLVIFFLALCAIVFGLYIAWHGVSSRFQEDKKLVILGPVICLLGVTTQILAIHSPGFEYSTGERVGFVVKLSKKGFMWPTWEGTMQLGPSQGGIAADSWDFSVSDEEMRKSLSRALEDGTRVKIIYHQFGLRGIAHGSTPYSITKVMQ